MTCYGTGVAGITSPPSLLHAGRPPEKGGKVGKGTLLNVIDLSTQDPMEVRVVTR